MSAAINYVLRRMQQDPRPADLIGPGSIAASLVSSVGIGGAVEQGLIFIEFIPCNVIDVEGKALDQTPHRRGSENDAVTGKTLHDAIIEAQLIGTRLLRYVEPQNLLFIFSESAQALTNFQLELPASKSTAQGSIDPLQKTDHQEGRTQQQPDSHNRAIVFCHILDAQYLQQLTGAKKQESQDRADCYEVLWGELEGLKNVLDNVSGHGSSVLVAGPAIVADGSVA